MRPEEWICAALSVGAAEDNFTVIGVEGLGKNRGSRVRVLHKVTGAVWVFTCRVEREGA